MKSLQVISQMHTEAYCTKETLAHITINETFHIEDPHHTEIIQHIPEIVVNLDHIPHTKTPT